LEPCSSDFPLGSVTVAATEREVQTKAERARDRIVAAAAQVFAQQGYAGARLSDIADVAMLQTGSLYYHFRDRAELVEEVIRRGVIECLEAARAAVAALGPSASALARLEAAMHAQAAAITAPGSSAPTGISLMIQVPPDIRDTYDTHFAEFTEYWSALIADAQEAGYVRTDMTAETLAHCIIPAIHSLLTWPPRLSQSVDSLSAMTSLLIRGLRPEPPGLAEEALARSR
jgi:TetR/AcrR family transcriptional regulator, cholesterol catabolism regulator